MYDGSLSDVDCAFRETSRVRSVVQVDATIQGGGVNGWLAVGTIPKSLYQMFFYLFLCCVLLFLPFDLLLWGPYIHGDSFKCTV